MTEDIRKVLAGSIGRPLRKVIAEVHLFEGEIGDEPLRLWFSFDGLPSFRIFGASNGLDLGVDRVAPEPVDMGESGETMLVDVSNKAGFGRAIHRDLQGVWLAEDPTAGVIGVRFDFGLPVKPVVVNWGDELYVAEDYPHRTGEEEIVEARVRPIALR